MEITTEFLKKYRACSEAVRWCQMQTTTDPNSLIELAKKDNYFDWINWMVTRLMNKNQKVQYAIFAAECVIDIYEKKYPEDDKPRKAIESAKAYLKDPCKRTKQKADADANDVYDSAYDSAAAYAADAAAYAAAYAADAATDTAHAIFASALAASAATVAYAADAVNGRVEMWNKIIDEAIEILKLR